MESLINASLPKGYDINDLVGDRGVEGAQAAIEQMKAQAISLGAADQAEGYHFLNEDEQDALPPPIWLVHNELQQGTTACIAGPSGQGKTFVALDYALSLAADGRPVVYVAAEGIPGYKMRRRAWKQYHGLLNVAIPFYLVQLPLNLYDRKQVENFMQSLKHQGIAPALIVVDTLALSSIGAEENSNSDMTIVTSNSNRLAEQLQTTVLLIHHTGKDGASERGASSIKGNIATMIKLTNDDGLITLMADKQRDAEAFKRYMRLTPQEVLIEGQFHPTMVAVPTGYTTAAVVNNKLTEKQQEVLRVLALSTWGEVGASAKNIEAASNGRLRENGMYGVLSALIKAGLVEQSKKGQPYKITDDGREALAAVDKESNPDLATVRRTFKLAVKVEQAACSACQQRISCSLHASVQTVRNDDDPIAFNLCRRLACLYLQLMVLNADLTTFNLHG